MTITINGISYSIPYPIGVTLTHEGGLDQANVTIKHIKQKDPFDPFTRVSFLDRWWVIGNDHVVDEIYSGTYTHTVMLLEATKELERVVCGAKTYTRPLKTELVYVSALDSKRAETYIGDYVDPDSEDSGYVGPNVDWATPYTGNSITIRGAYGTSWNTAEVDDSGATRYGTYVKYSVNDQEPIEIPVDGSVTINLSLGDRLRIIYYYAVFFGNDVFSVIKSYTEYLLYYAPGFDISRSQLAVKSVVDDFLAAAEPIRTDMDQRYIHVTDIEGCIDTSLTECPEISCANCSTLKEQMDQFAKILHAKVKMDINVDGVGLIYFVPLTSLDMASIKGTRIDTQYAFSSEKFAGRVQTNAANFVINNKGEGTMMEPFGYNTNLIQKTLRCSDNEARIGDETGEIETAMPIRRVNKLVITKPIGGETLDLTRYVNEEAVYLGLSSFEGEKSRCFSLYYTQGQHNIKGLFVKEANAISDILSDYTIENIWKDAGGTSTWEASEYKDALIYVEYEPYMNIRLVNSRVDGKGGLTTYVANQSANEVDRDALGDFMRGTAEQMASADKTRTYIFRSLSDLPTVGTMFDENNVISALSFEIYPYFVKATLNISEHYNKFGQYVEVPSAVRQYEVDVKNVRERSVLYTDVCTVSFNPQGLTSTTLATTVAEEIIAGVAGNDPLSGYDNRASAADVETYAEVNGVRHKLQSLSMPVNSFAFGNSLAFVIPFKDNFSAGTYAVAASSTYNAQNYAQYADSYGSVDLVSVKIYDDFAATNNTNRVAVGRKIPLSVDTTVNRGSLLINTSNGSPSNDPALLVLKKDSREKIIFTYQILLQGEDGIIIGQDLAKMCPLVKNYRGVSVEDARLCLFGNGEDIPYLDPVLGTARSRSNAEYAVAFSGNVVSLADGKILQRHSAWAIFRGDRFILGSNSPLVIGGARNLYFNFTHT